ncbi:acyl--CoA ligase [Hymenobacter sp. RP-2-7]|uniref:Acyl--CoA ligase n=1 Tax=Hymenobacter polaris TaxID=2682546 RepID=A0A7Y0FP51_9BACT|nr:AMP-binding protein [Hymenobacter polaris]NML67677.1 acyl--CoA ligase [Hymenobacter polaris]
MQAYFREFQRLAAAGNYQALTQRPVPKPEFFNWTADIVEGLHLAAHPDQPALVLADDAGSRTFSYAELLGQANQLLNYWRQRGVQPHEAVFLMVPVCAELWPAYLAGIKGGQVLVPAASILTAQDLAYRFGTLLPAVVLADAENAAKIDEAEQALGGRIGLKMLVGDPAASRPGWVGFGALAGLGTQAAPAPTRADDPLFLFFTSGTTGLPKVVTHTHFSYPVGHLSTAAWIGLRPTDRHCNVAQPGWAKFAWSSFFAPLSIGATVVAYQGSGRFAAGPLLAMLARERVSTFCAPPTVLRLLVLEDLAAYPLPALRECVSAGEPLNPEVITAWQRGTGHWLRDGYGQTESTAMLVNLPGAELRLGSMGQPSFMYDVAIADDAGAELPALTEGYIVVRTDTGRPNGLFKEYYGEPARAASVFQHGLYYTGDKAYRDPDGYFWFVGRDDDVIKSSGYRIGPFEVESVLLEHPAVVEAAVVGVPHPIKGHEVKAFVVLAAGAAPTAALAHELLAYGRAHLAPYKAPRRLELVAELPKTISGKIRRVELRARPAGGAGEFSSER